MANSSDQTKYDEVLSSILVNEKSILGFLSAIFNFLARRTDFYHVPEGPYENMGFPPGVAEELVIKVLRTCDPKSWKAPNGAKKSVDVNNEIMCSTVAQEVEVIAEEDVNYEDQSSNQSQTPSEACKTDSSDKMPQTESDTESGKQSSAAKLIPDDYEPPVIPVQQNSETYNGAEREKYWWSQTIMELDVTVKLPPDIKSSKELKVTINTGDICIARRNGHIIIKDSLPYKVKTMDSFWSISEGKLLIHMEKVQERWWDRLLKEEEPIDLSTIDASRPLNELPEDHIDKVRELQWNQERKMKGLPTSDEIRNIEILKKAWNAPGSPFQGQEFDPSVLSKSAFPPPEQ
uniref:Nuclear distribution protein NUDC n=1 Tax=Biston betularia TaxID=82595 RepID=E3UKM0_BISBE|nr:nuclear distribution protein NUDC [Biston betularia]